MIDRDELRRLCTQIPPLTYREIGQHFGVTGVRIRIIATAEGIHKPKAETPKLRRPHELPDCPYVGAMYIPLTKGMFAIVDAADYTALSQWKWHFSNGYAARYGEERGKPAIRMHRQIMSAPDDMDCDHINGNGLDNRRRNLRVCTRQQNLCNKDSHVNTKPYKGVFWNRRARRWFASIQAKGKAYYLGYFDTPEEAAVVYNKAARILHGQFARANEIPLTETEQQVIASKYELELAYHVGRDT